MKTYTCRKDASYGSECKKLLGFICSAICNDHGCSGTACTVGFAYSARAVDIGQEREMIDVMVGFIVITIVYLLGVASGLFASAQIIAGKEREEHEKELTAGSSETERKD